MKKLLAVVAVAGTLSFAVSPQDQAFSGIVPQNVPPAPQQLKPVNMPPAPPVAPAPRPAPRPKVAPLKLHPQPRHTAPKPVTHKPQTRPPMAVKTTPRNEPKPQLVNLQIPTSQSYFRGVQLKPPMNAKLLKSIVFTYKSSNGRDIIQKIAVNKIIDANQPIVITHNPANKGKIIAYNVSPLFKLYVAPHKFFIQTKDELVKTLALRNPARIALDFRTRAVPKFKTIVQPLKSDVASQMAIGYHGNGIYRVVFYLKKPYQYKIDRFNDGLKIEFK
ncbi:MAG: hypothetical protein C6I01_03845 [Epsilonproteobacteria bacterium]|jgi:hypothetical protein|nr:hypothetical protein [Campylobacterota bacterium]NPA88885.1 AMIN domain-containing protein [Campylobacterota bacterium]